jgi:phenylpropionate dioxygenase-like ring-hydroxylating dioxygenase large terminal subunit
MNTQTPQFERVGKDTLAWLGTGPIPAKPYYDPDYFEREREAVFRRSWIQIGHVCELPDSGDFIRRELEVLKASLLIVRGKDGEIRAFHNVCTHRGTELVTAESGRQSTFSCRYHMWTFGTDGALLSAPDFGEFYLDKADCALKQVTVDVCAGLIFVHLGTPESKLREWLGPMAEILEAMPIARATTYHEYVYDIDANWKLTFDNFQENYHLRFIHPAAAGPSCAPENPFGYPSAFGFHGLHRTQQIWVNPEAPLPEKGILTGFARGAMHAAARGLGEGGTGGKQYIALFPNFFLLGSATQHFSHTVYPIAADRSRGVIRVWWVGDDANASERFAREVPMATARDVHAEDRNVIIGGQKGLASGALEHIHFQAQESLCRHFFNAVDGMVRAYDAEREAERAR